MTPKLNTVGTARPARCEDAALIGFFAYWMVGLPIAVLLSMKFDLGAVGVWSGLAVGLFVACVMLAPRLWKMTVPAVATPDRA
jgi:Na+-driven multidrug efflux pump